MVIKLPGEIVYVDVTLQNTGNVAYNFLVDSAVVGLIDLTAQNVNLSPGQIITLTFSDVVPNNPGTYDVYAEVVGFDNQTRIGEVVVEAPAPTNCFKTDAVGGDFNTATWVSIKRINVSDPNYGLMVGAGKQSCGSGNWGLVGGSFDKYTDYMTSSVYVGFLSSIKYQILVVPFRTSPTLLNYNGPYCSFITSVANSADLTPC